MKVSRRFDASVCTAIILSARPAVASCGAQSCRDGTIPRSYRRAHTASAQNANVKSSPTCVNTPTWLRSTFLPAFPILRQPSSHRRISTSPSPKSQASAAETRSSSPLPPINVPRNPYTKEELLSLVDQQGVGPVDEYVQFHRDPYLRRYAEPDGPNLVISDRKEDTSYPSREDAVLGDGESGKAVGQLLTAVRLRLRQPSRVSLDTVFKLYSKLPEPRMLHISGPLRLQVLRALGTPERRDSKSMLRYFAAIADVKSCGLSLRLQEWNYALAFASRYVRKTTEVEAEATLKIWSEMEREAMVKGNEVTFNILFDVASKSGNFALAEMIYKEMEARQMPFNRYHHVSLIHYFGLKQDGDGVRAAYRDMVEAGEIIDSVVLNCVISGLLRSGEEAAAEEVYERMKRSGSADNRKLPERDYVTKKVITKVLMMFGKLGKKHPTMTSTFQNSAVLSPDIQTYRIMVNHFSLKVGDIAKVARYLDEMKLSEVSLHGSIFLALFKGFSMHGGFAGATWSEQRLRGVFAALLDALDTGVKGLSIEVWLAMWILRAFKKCVSTDATRETYEILKERMHLTEAQEGFMEEFLGDLLADKDLSMYKGRGHWGKQPGKRKLARRRLS
ncbi:uncharacterized protein DNG_06015 [Cephalotrichum gorgonifer]|uniref:Pentatricopeptide repeat protein n=1 Tax=Cephalotrichum gorgonifer TaxID=2041049 RepID=A0AAE8N0X0_9PEZI|nr:uncharacterized protein DNG_06015 [Cephalotrichum gorgonifer]